MESFGENTTPMTEKNFREKFFFFFQTDFSIFDFFFPGAVHAIIMAADSDFLLFKGLFLITASKLSDFS